MKLRPYQQEFVDSDYSFLFWWMRLGKTFTALSAGKKRYPGKTPIIVTKNSIITSNLHPLSTGGWLKEGQVVYGNKFGLDYYMSEKTKLTKGNGIIVGSHHTKLVKLLEDKRINWKNHYLILDEMHVFKNPGEVKFDKRSKTTKITGKRGYYAAELSEKVESRLLGLTATPSGVGYIDYANYFIMLGEYLNFEDFKRQHVNYKPMQIMQKRGLVTIMQVDHNNYSNLDKLEALVKKYSSVMDRNAPELIEFMGREPILEVVGVRNHKSLKDNTKNKSHFTANGIEMELTPFDLAQYKHRFSYGYLDSKNEKIQKILDTLDENNRVVVFYSYTQDAITISRAIEGHAKANKEHIETQIVRGDGGVEDFDYKVYDKGSFTSHEKGVLLVQYDAGSEGLTLYDVAAVIIHYSLPNKYYQYKQSSARTDGPLEGRYGIPTNIVLVSDTEIDKYTALSNKKDYDVTISTHIF